MTAGGKVFLAGVIVAAAGAAILAATVPLPWSIETVRAAPAAAGTLSFGLALAILGAFVYVFQPALDPQAGRRMPHATVRTVLAMLLVAIVIGNLAALPVVAGRGQALPAAGAPQVGPLALAYLIAVSELSILVVLWARLVAPGGLSWRELGLKVQPLGEYVGAGIVGGCTLFLYALVVGGILTRFGVRQNQSERFLGIQHAPLSLFLLTVFAGCVLAPFVEELFFRGYVFQSLYQRWGPVWAYLFSAGLFAVVHLNLAAAAPIFALGLALAYIYRRTGSLVPGMIAHGLNNLIAFCLLYFVGAAS